MKKYISIGAVLAGVAIIYVLVPRVLVSSLSTPASSAATAASATTTVNALLLVGTTTYPIEVRSGETVIDAMRTLRSTGTFSFTGRDYPALGFFVDSVNGVKNADGRYWILYVNGVSATAGASAVTLHAGDTIEWRHEKSY